LSSVVSLSTGALAVHLSSRTERARG
jgi:hypothetical protein